MANRELRVSINGDMVAAVQSVAKARRTPPATVVEAALTLYLDAGHIVEQAVEAARVSIIRTMAVEDQIRAIADYVVDVRRAEIIEADRTARASE